MHGDKLALEVAISLTQLLKKRIFICCWAVCDRFQSETICRAVWTWMYNVSKLADLRHKLETGFIVRNVMFYSNFGVSVLR